MTDERMQTDDWKGYDAARQRNNEFHGEYLRSFSERSYEYGVLAVKNFMLISGGALVALPALAKLSNDYNEKMAIYAGVCFAICLLTSLLCTYVIHLNWTLLFESQDLMHSRDQYDISRTYLPSLHTDQDGGEDYQQKIDAKNRIIWWTWLLPHILGISGFAVFLLGSYFFYSGFGFSEVKQ